MLPTDESIRRYASVCLWLMLAACGGGGSGSSDGGNGAPPPSPTVELTASHAVIQSGDVASLSWTSTAADACSASGAWSGNRSVSGSESTGPLTANVSYTLTCTGPGGSDSDTATITVNPVTPPPPPPPPVVTLVAVPASVLSGSGSTLSWTAGNATACVASGVWSGDREASGSEETGPLTSDAGYTLTCTGPGGSDSDTVVVSITAVTPPPTVFLTASPAAVDHSASSTLDWITADATECVASGGWDGPRGPIGSEETGPLTVETTYTLACAGPGGSSDDTVTVVVAPEPPPPPPPPPVPTVTLTADPATVDEGGAVTLHWSSTDALTCTASGDWSGSRATSGSHNTGPLETSSSFTLSCEGDSGAAADTVSVTVIPSGDDSLYPLSVAPGGRHLLDAQGRPFLMHGDTAWSLFVQVTKEEAEFYLEDRRQKGFNAILVNLIEFQRAVLSPANIYGDVPFLVGGDYSTPNEDYFAHAEWVIAKAAEKGILMVLVPSYMGFNQGDWYPTMSANGTTKLHAYGEYIATRFAAHRNILWAQGGDYNPPSMGILRSIPNGIRDVSDIWLQTFHGSRNTNALMFVDPDVDPWLTVNNIYTNETTVVSNAYQEYQRSSMPFFLIEARYENEGSGGSAGTPLVIRRQAYQTYLSGGFGHLMGNRPIWRFDEGWEAALDSPGSRSMTHVRDLLTTFDWWQLVPDMEHEILISGADSGGTQAVAARIGSAVVLVYVPTLRPITIDLDQLAGPQVRARWFDPGDGSFAAHPESPFAASGSRVFNHGINNSAGAGDWVLVLESIP